MLRQVLVDVVDCPDCLGGGCDWCRFTGAVLVYREWDDEEGEYEEDFDYSAAVQPTDL